jgi:hypothetical protein
MALSYVKLLRLARCGELSYICCLTRQQLLSLSKILVEMDDDDIDLLYTAVCGCAVNGQNPGGGGLPGGGTTPGEACTEKLLSVVCSSNGQTLISGAKVAGAAALAAAPSPEIKVLIGLVLAAIETLDLACENKEITKSMLTSVCEAYGTWQALKDSIPEPFKTILDTVTIVFAPTALIGGAIQACCDTGAGGTISSSTSTKPVRPFSINPAVVAGIMKGRGG